MDGRQFVTSCSDGSLVTWNAVGGKPPPQQSAHHNKPTSVVFPHGKKSKDGAREPCDPIQKVFWGVSRSSYEPYFVFRYTALQTIAHF